MQTKAGDDSIHNMRNPFSIYRCRDMGLHMLRLLHAIIPCLCLHACCTLTLFLYFVALQSLTSFNILVKMFLHLFHCFLLCVATHITRVLSSGGGGGGGRGEASPPNTPTSPPNIQASPPVSVACMHAVT